MKIPKFILITKKFLASELALNLKHGESKDTRVIVQEDKFHSILENIMDKESDYVQFMGEGNIFITDDGGMGKLADNLRAKGEFVVGGSKLSDKWESDRKTGQDIMRRAGIHTVKSHNFKGLSGFSEAEKFVKEHPGRWVIKQNGDNEKDLSTVGKFSDGRDVIDKLDDMKRI